MTARRRLAALGLLAMLLCAAPAAAQSRPAADPDEAYLRLLQLTGEARSSSFSIRPLMDGAWSELSSGGHPWSARVGADPFAESGSEGAAEPRIRPTEAQFQLFGNTRHPFGGNDGVVWQGKGATTAFEAGAEARWKWLSIRVQPVVTVSQNASFELAPVQTAGTGRFAYPWRRIDVPQRFGDDAVSTVHPGDSEVRATFGALTFGASTRNLWWGPGVHHSILMGNNAPGFVHGFLGTARPVDIWIGDLEAHYIWGRLGESDYFDDTEGSFLESDRFTTGIAVTYRPAFAENLYFGATRLFYGLLGEGRPDAGDFFLIFQGVRKENLATEDNPLGNDEEDQMLSLFARWVLPESGVELYGEWARNDHALNFRDFFLEPEHSQGYTLGLRKAVRREGDRRLLFGGELITLQRGRTREVRATPIFYAHHIVEQGFTQDGQLIGSNVGPGGSAQHLTAEMYDSWGRAGVELQRRVFDNDAFFDFAQANDLDFCCHHVGLSAGLDALVFVRDLDVGGGLMITRELNRYFERGNDVWNLNLRLSARWRPR